MPEKSTNLLSCHLHTVNILGLLDLLFLSETMPQSSELQTIVTLNSSSPSFLRFHEAPSSEMQPDFVHHTVAWSNPGTLTRNPQQWCVYYQSCLLSASQSFCTWEWGWGKSGKQLLPSDSASEYPTLLYMKASFCKGSGRCLRQVNIIKP